MSEMHTPTYSVNLRFEAIKLPPVTDILVLAKKHPHGKIGIMESFKFMAPDEFEMFDIGEESPEIEAVLINKRILKRMDATKVIAVLARYVFPYASSGEALKVTFDVRLAFENINGAI